MKYRSSIIESSAALEISVEKKLIQKMKEKSMTEEEISKELGKTITNFTQRCDHFMKKYTGVSFVKEKPKLWNKIDIDRKNYRHKIAHSDLKPTKKETEKIINDFEEAIKYIEGL